MPNSTSIEKTCPQCGAPISAQAPEGLCPRCVAALNLQGDTMFTGAADATAQAAPSPADLSPHFPQLEVLEYMGRGGMGVVYKARQKSLNRLVALKLLAPERVTDGKFAARFAEEAKALAALSHPNIVTIYDFGQAGGFYYLLMEFVDGVNLRQAMKAGRFTPEQALSVVPPVCEGLQYAHEHGIVHRDIKPENLLLDREGRVKIADFGIAKMLGSDAGGVGAAESQPAGTPQYMAPEQRTTPERAGQRADIYSLGVVLYEMLTGELPTAGLPAPSKRVRVDVRIDEIVLRALETKPELRYATAAEFRADVEGVAGEPARVVERQQPKSTRADPAMITVAFGVVIYFIAVSFGFLVVENTNLRSGSGYFFNLLLALLVAVPLAPAISRRVQRKLESGEQWEIKTAHGWFKAFASLAFLFGVPAVGLGIVFVLGLAAERWGWNPAPAEAVMVPAIWLGAILLPAAGSVLWREAKRLESGNPRMPDPRPKVLRVLVIPLGIALVLSVFTVCAWLLIRKPTPSVKVRCVPSGVIGNALIVDLQARPSDGPAAVWLSFTGPAIDTAVIGPTMKLIEGSGTDFLAPTFGTASLPPRVMNEFNVWRVAFLFPTAALANQALGNLRSMDSSGLNLLEVLFVKDYPGRLFEVRTKDGEVYRASCLVSAPERTQSHFEPLEQSRASAGTPFIDRESVQTRAKTSETKADPPAAGSRKFSLRHRLASQMREDLRSIVPEHGDVVVSLHADNQQIEIQGPAAIVDRAATFITVMDWPDSMRNAATGEYLSNSVLRTARSFFHACATEESPASFSKLLSPHVLAVLKGEAKTELYENYMVGGVPDAAWEASLRADWPGKEEAIRRFVASWNRYPLKRITEQPGIAMGFGVKHFCSVSFEGAPKEFYEVTIEPERTKPPEGEEARFYFSSLPPWWEGEATKGGEETRAK